MIHQIMVRVNGCNLAEIGALIVDIVDGIIIINTVIDGIMRSQLNAVACGNRTANEHLVG